MSETYILQELHEEKKYCLFPDGYKKGFRCHYFLFTRTVPLRNGEVGYDETHCCVRGLEILSLNLNALHNLEYNSANILTPIYVVSLAHFLNKSVRYREGQRHIYGIKDIWRKNAPSPGMKICTFVYS